MLSRRAVREILDCTETELERWIEDGRLEPDGKHYFFHFNVPYKRRWALAWLPATVDSAKALVPAWRSQDALAISSRWRSERELYDLVRSRFPDAVRQLRPKWLLGQSVDIYVDSIRVAFEYQGIQHFEPVPYFGGEEALRWRQVLDARKRERLAAHCIALVEWRFDTSITDRELDRALALVNRR